MSVIAVGGPSIPLEVERELKEERLDVGPRADPAGCAQKRWLWSGWSPGIGGGTGRAAA